MIHLHILVLLVFLTCSRQCGAFVLPRTIKPPPGRTLQLLSSPEEELEHLQTQMSLIEALQERNKAQLDSFIDEQDQWNSLEPEERELLQQKDALQERIERLLEELVQGWMGQKSMDG